MNSFEAAAHAARHEIADEEPNGKQCEPIAELGGWAIERFLHQEGRRTCGDEECARVEASLKHEAGEAQM